MHDVPCPHGHLGCIYVWTLRFQQDFHVLAEGLKGVELSLHRIGFFAGSTEVPPRPFPEKAHKLKDVIPGDQPA